MKRRTGKIFIFFVVTAIAVLLSFLLSACMDVCLHQFGEWSPLFNATCETEGMDLRTCMLCGYTETQTHRKTDHTYGAVRINVRPTCTDSGNGAKTCTVCGATQTVDLSVNPFAHKWGTPAVRPATCTENGESVRICELCETADTEILPAGHKFDDAYSCHDRTCSACHTFVPGDGNHTFINDACACGTPHPDFTLSKAAERIRAATAKTLAHDDDFSVAVTDGGSQEIVTFFPLLGEFARFFGLGEPAPALALYTLRQNGALYYYDLRDRKAYLASSHILRQQISIKQLYGDVLKNYQPPADESKITEFSFSSDGALTLTATLILPDGAVTATFTEQNGILTELTVHPKRNEEPSILKYRFNLSPDIKITAHPGGVKDSDFAIADTYTVNFIATIGSTVESFSAQTGAQFPLPVGNTANSDYQIDGWYYDADFHEPYEESTVPYTPIPLTLYAKTSLKSNITYLTLHIVGADIAPKVWTFPSENAFAYLENAVRATFPSPSSGALPGLTAESGYTRLGLFTDSKCTIPLGDTLPAGEITVYLKVEPYANLILKFPTDLPEYPADLSYYYSKTAAPSISAETFLNEVTSRTGKCFTLWLDATYTLPYAETLPENGILYLKRVPQENYVFVNYVDAETEILLTRIEAELNYAVYLLNPFDLDDPTRRLVCTGIWFDSDCMQSAVGELITPEGELTLYCTFVLAPPDSQTLGHDT